MQQVAEACKLEGQASTFIVLTFQTELRACSSEGVTAKSVAMRWLGCVSVFLRVGFFVCVTC